MERKEKLQVEKAGKRMYRNRNSNHINKRYLNFDHKYFTRSIDWCEVPSQGKLCR